jgi:sterol desaturase/sphingolipid hydroxylase (fatty acid hydroxylase superfamily)
MIMTLQQLTNVGLPAVYTAAIALEAGLARRQVLRARYEWRDTLANIAMGWGNFLVGLLMSGVVLAGLGFAYRHRLWDVPAASPLAWLAIFLLDDFVYYWFHRLSHERRFWWAAHVNHHSSQLYNFSTAVRQNWTGLMAGTWLPWVPLALLGFPPWMILAQQTVSLFYQFWIHTQAVQRLPAWVEAVFNTPSHHRVHHASNPRYLDRNYGGILILWDRWFGTFVPESADEPVRFGIVKNIHTYNPLRIALHEWQAMGRDLLAARSLREAAGVSFGPPGWRADGEGETSQRIRQQHAIAPQRGREM